MKWENIEKITQSLNKEYPDEEVSEICLEDLHAMIIQLDDFNGNIELYDEEILQKILESWQEKNYSA